MKVKALVAVRSGSMRVKNKNLRPFAGSSLLEVKVKQLMRIPNLDGVDTVDEQVAIAKRKAGIPEDAEDIRLERFEVVRHF
mgnify:CR=1 FL=1